MLRTLHKLPGLWLALMLAITSATGAILAVEAGWDTAIAMRDSGSTMNLADLAERITTRLPDVEKITRTPSGRVRVTYTDDGLPQSVFVDPATVQPLGPQAVSPTMRVITNLHRAWLAGDGGRAAAGLSALVMLALTVSGLMLLQRQLGGWAKLVQPIPMHGARRWHLELGRFAAAGLLLSAATGIYLSLAGFDVVPDGANRQQVQVASSAQARLPLGQLTGLAELTLADLRELTLPNAGDPQAPITVETSAGIRQVDSATGATLAEQPHSLGWQIHDLAYRLHTAQGMIWLAVLLGLCALSGTLLAVTGVLIWFLKHRGGRAISGSHPASRAGIVLLVGSEGRTTWGFASTLHQALARAGHIVHVAAMNDLPEAMPLARQMILLAATAGGGEAPASATAFLDRLAKRKDRPMPQTMIVGFGDRQFPDFCGYARQVETALRAQGVRIAMPTELIDGQCVATFAQWGARLASHLDTPLVLDHQPRARPATRFQLVEREDYGMEVQAPTAILRFRPMHAFGGLPAALARALRLTPRFAAGDLVGICPPDETHPRLYSIASASAGGILELCVRRQPGGMCSSFLHNLMPGDVIEGHIRPHPAFRPDNSARPLVLIGAGTGIAPLVGFVREHGQRRPIHLYWGGRDPASDYLYRDELQAHALEGRIASLNTVFSRVRNGGYVQHLVAADSAFLQALVVSGAQILICGAVDMAEGVRQALAAALEPLGLDPAQLRHEGRLIEDVY